tara:strand:- start:277 stop:426 length:150 start_codon:yes stop_codon:yes gene_type:complete
MKDHQEREQAQAETQKHVEKVQSHVRALNRGFILFPCSVQAQRRRRKRH